MSNEDQPTHTSLTVANMKRHEQETGSVGVVELMTKSNADNEAKELNTTDGLYTRHGNPDTTVVTRSIRNNGEEFIAVSIEMQTEESCLLQTEIHIDTETSGSLSENEQNIEAVLKVHGDGHETEMSTTEDMESNDGQYHPIIDMISKSPASGLSQSLILDSSVMDDNPVAEMNILDTMGPHTPTTEVSSVGAPYILQYKPESKAHKVDYDNIKDTASSSVDWETMKPEDQTYFNNLLEEAAKEREKSEKSSQSDALIDIEPHAAYGSQQERKMAKEHAAERMRAREVERQKQTIPTNQTNFYAFARQLKTVNYSLSSEKCMEEGWTIRPITPPQVNEPIEEFIIQDSQTAIASGRPHEQIFVERYYDNGSIFLAVFSDGTGNIWYPSGNIAISIVASENVGKPIFMLHEDKDPGDFPCIQAIFQPNGKCTCYHPNGAVRINLSSIGGEYFNPNGERIKKWKWKNTQTHVHAPPFQPIVCGLNRQVGIRIVSQENIHVTFSDAKRSVRFNVGCRLRLKNSLARLDPLDADIISLHEKTTFIQSIMERMNNIMKFSKSPRVEKLRLPNYLTNKMGSDIRISIQPNTNKDTKVKQTKSKRQIKQAKNMESAIRDNSIIPAVIVN